MRIMHLLHGQPLMSYPHTTTRTSANQLRVFEPHACYNRSRKLLPSQELSLVTPKYDPNNLVVRLQREFPRPTY
jgi:hypothetical protein